MSKNGSITPRTVRKEASSSLQLAPGEADVISQYDDQFRYVRRNEVGQEILKKKASGERALDGLKIYCDGNSFLGLEQAFKVKFSKITEVIPKVSSSVIKSDQIADSLRFMTVFQHRENDGIADLDCGGGKPLVRHYGINSVSSAIFIGHVIGEGTLHPIEVRVFESAVEHLEGRYSAQECCAARGGAALPGQQPLPPPPPLNPNNVVLVSFFSRKIGNKDKFLGAKIIVADEKSTKEAETHTIALWKTGPKEITIIDPSDRTYSQPLVEILNKTPALKSYNFRMESSTVEGVEGKIYKPKHHAPSDKLSTPRDCTDIAVKIAFEFNEQQANPSVVSVDKVLTNTIEQISNARLPKEIGLFRALQSSDVDMRHAAKELVDKAKLVEAAALKVKTKCDDDAILKVLDVVAKIRTLEQIQEVSDLIGELNMDFYKEVL